MSDYYLDVPDSLKNSNNWIRWKLELNTKGKLTKVPKRVDGVNNAASDDKTTWGMFNQVENVLPTKDGGIGYCFDGTGKYGIDLDGFFNPNGTDYIPFIPIVKTIESYQEVSPSDVGIHIVFECDEKPYPTGKTKQWFTDENGNIVDKDTPGSIKREVGLFGVGKYFTVTGALHGPHTEIRKIPADVIRSLLDPFLNGSHPIFKKPEKDEPAKTTGVFLYDKQLVELATRARNGAKFELLMHGDTTGYPSDSEADMALATMIAFYTSDVTQIQRIMRDSGLNREKWDKHQTYLYDTIDKAVSLCREHYTPPGTQSVTPIVKANGDSEKEPPKARITKDQMQEIRENHSKTFGELPDLPEGFFHDYMEYGKRMTYAYPAFHFAGALTLVSLVCGRRVVMQSTASEIYLNTYILCVGPTSISGKSTANDKVGKFFSLIRQEGAIDELPKKLSPQGLLQRLSKIPCRYWPYDECSEFFSDSQAHWGEALESNLCSIYDGRASGYGLSIKKKEESEWNVKDVFVSCLWNTTDSGIEERLQYRSVSSGLVPRFMWFWMQGDNLPRENRSVTTEDILAEADLQRQLWALRDILMPRPLNTPSIRFKVNPIIEKWMLDDVMEHRQKEDEMHRVCTARLFPQAYKMAMMFSLMDTELQSFIKNAKPEEPLTLTIPDKYADLAKQIAENYLRPRLEHVINLAKYNDSKNYQDMIRKSIEKHGTVATKSHIIRDTRIPKRNLEEALQTMLEGDILEDYEIDDDTRKGRPVVAYRLIGHTS